MMDRRFGLGLIGLAVASAYLYGSSFIVPTPFGDPAGAAGLPRILGWLLVVVSLLIIAQAGFSQFRFRRQVAKPGADADGPSVFDTSPGKAWLRGMGVVALAVAFIVLFPQLGYPVAAALLILGTSLFFGMPLTWRVPVVAVAGAFVMWLTFGVLFRVRLPMGVLEPFVG